MALESGDRAFRLVGIFAGNFNIDAVDAQHCCCGFETIGFLDTQFLKAAHCRHAFRKRGSDCKHKIFAAEIDYEDNLEGARFVIRNPNAQTTCGCGSSFSV
mgnify:CR=1 FL=1